MDNQIKYQLTVTSHESCDECGVKSEELQKFEFDTKKEARKKVKEFLKAGYTKIGGELINYPANRIVLLNF